MMFPGSKQASRGFSVEVNENKSIYTFSLIFFFFFMVLFPVSHFPIPICLQDHEYLHKIGYVDKKITKKRPSLHHFFSHLLLAELPKGSMTSMTYSSAEENVISRIHTLIL